jgi:putative ABC transport system permease protein
MDVISRFRSHGCCSTFKKLRIFENKLGAQMLLGRCKFHLPMISHAILRAFRNIQKNGTFTLVNVLGLSLGMTAFVLIVQYVSFEKSYNSFHTNLPELYRVLNETKAGEIDAYTAPGFAPLAASQITGIDQFCRLAEGRNLGTGIVSLDNAKNPQSFREEDFTYADGNFFTVFSFPVAMGNGESLHRPNTVAISRTTSTRYFGNDSPIGKTLTLNNQFGKTVYTVEAVYDDMPAYSDIQYDLVFSLQTLANNANLDGNEAWASLDGTGSQWLYTYLKVRTGTDPELIAKSYTTLIHTVNPEDKSTIILQSVESMHLGRSLGENLPTFGSLKFVYLLSGIAFLILIIAWFNYVNLSTAGALKRAKEVGIRKVTGATKGQLIRQFLGESAVLNILAFFIALTFITALQHPYSMLINKEMSLAIMFESDFWLVAVSLLVMGTLASGAYTAFVLASFNPSKVLKGVFSKSKTGIFVRKSLVIFQFSISLILISVTIVLYQQWQFMQNMDLGMDTSQLLVIRGAEVNKDETFKDRSVEFENNIRNSSFVQEFSRSGNVPTDGFNFSTGGLVKQGAAQEETELNYEILMIDQQYFDTYGITLAAGANFTPEMCSKQWNEMKYVMLNERASAQLGFETPQQAVGQKIQWEEREFEVRGVVKDYHHLAVQYAIGPIVFVPSGNGGYYTLKLGNKNFSEQLATLESFYRKSFPGNPFEYQFLDQTFEIKYNTEKQYSIIFTIASCLAVFIGCLGLFGLATYSVEQRSKEIGIRKVLGSSVPQIIRLLSNDFLMLVVIAFVLSIPISWWALEQWLNSFVYRVEIAWWIYGVAGAVTFAIAWITVGTQAFKGAVSNPVNSLRSE